MAKRLRFSLVLVALAALLCGQGHQLSAQASVWFRANFDVLGPQNLYNFANRFAQSATTWQTTHLPTGGWNGSGAPRVTIKGCNASTGRPCNTAENQFNVGWQTPALTNRSGDSTFIRFRLKPDPDTYFGSSGRRFGAKFVLDGTSGSNRWIIHWHPPQENDGCGLGFEAYSFFSPPWTPPSWQWYRASEWGLTGNFRDGTNANRFSGIAPNVNSTWSCAPAMLVQSSNATPMKPQRNGAAPVDGWYHLQFQAVNGSAGQAALRSWANNNDQTNPSSERTNLPDALTARAASVGIYVGGYWGIAQPQDIGFVIDDFEAGPTFDPAWYPGGGTQPPPTCTTTPDVTSITYTAPGGSKAVNVAANLPTCAWSSTEALSWLAVAPVSVTGSGQVLVTADPNPGTATRVGTVTVAGRVISVSQPGTPAPPPCTFMVTPPSATVGATGGSGTLSVTATAPTCTWTGSSAAAWLTLSDGSGTGSGEVIYSASANPGLSRSGVLTIGGQTVTVAQDGAPVPTTLTTRCAVDVTTEIGTGAVTGIQVVQPCPPTAAAARGRKR